MVHSRWFTGISLAAAMALGAGYAVAQGDGSMGGGQHGQMGQQGAQGCPMMQAHRSVQQALDEGATVTVEQTPHGATIRMEAPAGDQQAIEDARTAAQQLARAGQGYMGGAEGCGCPMMPTPGSP